MFVLYPVVAFLASLFSQKAVFFGVSHFTGPMFRKSCVFRHLRVFHLSPKGPVSEPCGVLP